MKPTLSVKRWLACSASISSGISNSTLSFVVGFAACGLASVQAADIQWTGATASYNTPASWAGGVVPGANDNAFVNNAGGTVQILPADPPWYVIDFRASGGSYVQSGSKARLSAWMRMGVDAATTGTYTLSGGTLEVPTGNFYIGEAGTGVFNMSGGVLNLRGGDWIVGNRSFGPNTTGVGVVNQSGGSINSYDQLWLAQGSTTTDLCGTYEMSNGVLNLANWLLVGRAGGNGKFHMTGGAIHKSPHGGGNIVVGSYDGALNSTGEWIQDGGTVASGGELWVGQGANFVGNNAAGIYTLNSGTLEVSNWIAIGREGSTGTLNVNGGTIRKLGNGGFTLTGAGVVNHAGGFVDIQSGNLLIGENATSAGIYNLGGTGVVQAPQTIVVLNNDANISGIFNLMAGGTLRTGRLYKAGSNAGSSATATFDGGTVVATAHEPNFISGLSFAEIREGGLTVDSNGFETNSPQVFSGPGIVTKTGRGSFGIGSASFIGGVQVNGGVMDVDGDVSAQSFNVNVADGAGISGTGSIFGDLNIGTSADSYLLADSAAASPLKVPIGTLKVAKTRVDFANNNVPTGTPILVATYGIALDNAAGDFILGRPGTVDTSTFGEVWVTVNPARNLTWSGGVNSTWDIYNTLNWDNAGAAKFGQGDTVSFGNPASPLTVSINGPVRPAAISVNNTNPITLQGSSASADVLGSVVLTKAGTGKLTIGLDTGLNPNVTTPSPIPSTVTVNAGELQLGNGGTTGSVGRAPITNNALLSFNYSGDKIIANTINGSGGSISKSGAGTVKLTGSVAYTGTTLINAGRLNFVYPALPGSGAITNNGELEITNSTNSVVENVDAVIGGSGKLYKTGTDEVWLRAANTFTGDVEASQGNNNSLNITHAQALGTAAGKTIINGYNGNTGQFLNIRSLTGGTTLAEPFVLNANAFGRAGLRHEGGTQVLTLTGPITINSTGMAAVQFSNLNATSTLNIQGDITGPAMHGGIFFFRGSSGPINVTGSVNIADNAELVVTDGASVRIGGAGKTYQNFRTTIAVGQLRTLASNTLPADQPVHIGQDTNACKLILGEGSAVTQTIAGLTSTPNTAASGIVAGGAATASTLTVNQAYNSDFNLPIGGTGTNENLINLEKTGKGALALSGTNTYTGTTKILAGTLLFNGSSPFSAVTVSPGATAAGSGTSGVLTATGTAGNTANISPGNNGVGTLSVQGNLVLGTDSAINWQVQDWNGPADKIAASARVSLALLTSTNPCVIRISQLNLANFSETNKTFAIAVGTNSFTGTFATNKFVLDTTGFTAGTGTWSVSTNAASPFNTIFLNYTAGTTGNYATWANTHGIPGVASNVDSDLDGLTNLVEYALNLNPIVPNGSPGTYTGGTISFTKGTEAVTNGDVTYAIQTSTTLAAGSWTTVVPTVNNATTISYAVPTGQPRTFARLIVTKIP